MSWKDTLAQVAPTLATALGGPLAGMAAKVAVTALGGGKGKDPEAALEEAIKTGDPNVFLQLKQAEQTFLLELERLGVERERIAGQDRASARAMAQSTTLIPQSVLAAVFITGFIAVLWAVFGGGMQLDDKMRDTGIYLLGILSAGITQVMNFFFGSSAGSKQKDAQKGGK